MGNDAKTFHIPNKSSLVIDGKNLVQSDSSWDLHSLNIYEKESVKEVSAEYFFCFLPIKTAINILKRLLDIIKPGGTLTITMADMDIIADFVSTRTYPIPTDTFRTFTSALYGENPEFPKLSGMSGRFLRKRLEKHGFTLTKAAPMPHKGLFIKTAPFENILTFIKDRIPPAQLNSKSQKKESKYLIILREKGISGLIVRIFQKNYNPVADRIHRLIFFLFKHFNTGKDIRLNLGCGKITSPDYINVDCRKMPEINVVTNITHNNTFKSGSSDLIYASHILEHLSFKDALKVLKEWHRILKPGGKLIIGVPDIVKLFTILDDLDEDGLNNWAESIWGGQDYAENIHLHGYSFEFLKEILSKAGFAEICKIKPKRIAGRRDATFSKVGGRLISLNIRCLKK